MNYAKLENSGAVGIIQAFNEQADPEALQDQYRRQAQDFGARFVSALKDFHEIVGIAGPVSRDDDPIVESKPIVVAHQSVKNVGRGVVRATVFLGTNLFSPVRTNYQLVANGITQQLDDETLTTVDIALCGGYPFAKDPSGSWIIEPGADMRSPDYIWRKISEFTLPNLRQAEKTIHILKVAMQNPELNGNMAPAAHAAFASNKPLLKLA